MLRFRPYLSAARLVAAQGKGGYKPPDEWTAATFAAHGTAMRFALARTSKIVVRQARPAVQVAAGRVIYAQIDAALVIASRKLVARHTRSAIDEITVTVADEDIWVEAFNQVMAGAGNMLEAELTPILNSVAQQGFSKTSLVLGIQPDPIASNRFANYTREVGQRITQIDETTRRQFAEAVGDAMAEEGSTIRDVSDAIRDRMKQFTEPRLATIARTETQNVWTAGSLASMKLVPGIRSIDVIGCESREMDRWNQPSYQQFMWQGESTCNIEGVAIADAHSLNFHPNHTGTMVPGTVE